MGGKLHMKRILINAVAAKMGGATRHLKGFLQTLGEVDKDKEREYWVYVDSNVEIPSVTPNIYICYTSFPSRSFLHRLYFDQVKIPRVVKKYGIDVVVSILNFGPIKLSVKQVVFQRNSTYFCDYFLQMTRGLKKIKILLQRWMAYKAMQSSKIIVTPSCSMRDMIHRFYPDLSEDKFRVVPHGFDCEAFLNNSQPLPEDTEKLLKESSDGSVKLLYVSHPAKWKGTNVLFDSIRILKETTDEVVLYIPVDPTGDINKNKGVKGYDEAIKDYISLISNFDIKERVVCVGWLSPETIVNLYKKCDIFVFPSLCESFGFPMVEAMAVGLPIVAADTPVNREILGDAALYYSPLSSHELAESIKILMKDGDLKKELIKNGKNRIEEYDWSWKRYIKEILKVIEEV
jgi:glycosyltransferase involved in cell wall biosynthesis